MHTCLTSKVWVFLNLNICLFRFLVGSTKGDFPTGAQDAFRSFWQFFATRANPRVQCSFDAANWSFSRSSQLNWGDHVMPGIWLVCCMQGMNLDYLSTSCHTQLCSEITPSVAQGTVQGKCIWSPSEKNFLRIESCIYLCSFILFYVYEFHSFCWVYIRSFFWEGAGRPGN